MIRAEEFAFRYPTGEGQALTDLSFEIDEGETLGVVGPVEAGKTTLAMAIASFAPQNTGGATDGSLSVAGRDPRQAKDNRVAMVFEDYSAQLTQVRVIDEVIAPLVNRGLPRADAIERARELLDTVGLETVDEEKYTWEISGGQQQRLAIAAALAIDPDVMVFDTATDMLDPAGRDDVANLIASLKGEKTLVVTENDPDKLVGIADRLLVLDGGERVAFGPADDLLRDIDLLEGIGVAPPVCCRAARDVGLSGSPLTPGEFLDALDAHGVSAPRQTVPDGRGEKEGPGTASGAQADTPPSEFGDSLVSAEAVDHEGEPEQSSVAARSETPLLRAEDVRYQYSSDEIAVEDLKFTVHGGEVHAIIGGNGAGKTTFSKLLVGLFKPDNGTVFVDDEPTHGRTARDIAESVGITLQNPDEQLSEQTVEKEIRFPLEKRQYERSGFLGLSKRERYDDSFIDERVEEVCDLVGLSDDVLQKDPMFLPRGVRRQVTMATALAPDPDVLVLDEPVAGVDADARAQMTEAIRRLRDQGKGVVVIDHDMDFVCEVADTVTVLEDGQVVMQGPTHEVFAYNNWDWLEQHHMRPPRAARLARRVGVDALTADEFIQAFAPRLEVSG